MQSKHRLSIWRSVAFALLCLIVTADIFAQDALLVALDPGEKLADTTSIRIPDVPTTIDPATFVSARLAASVSVKFREQPLRAVFNWLREEQSLDVLVDYNALARAKILETDPVSDESKAAPLYLLLNRLERLGLGWFEFEGVLHFTSREEYRQHDSTVPYNVGDLFDAGYAPQDLLRTIVRCSGGQWDCEKSSGDSAGSVVLLGDVAFVRQTYQSHHAVAGLLAAIRQHGRRTFALDAPQHATLRAALDRKISVDFQETPLIVAIEELSRLSEISIRLESAEPGKGSVRERTPVSLKLADQKLSAVLRSLLPHPKLSWYLQDDALWVTTGDAANQFQKTAVYDVRDLCRDRGESTALIEAIRKQTRERWPDANRMGILESPRPGILVARHNESTLDEVLQLLENYRTALRASRLRVVAGPDPQEVITGYYRLARPMAADLDRQLRRLVLPGTWKHPDNPNGIGSIDTIAAQPTSVDAKGAAVETSILVIRQSRAAHQLIGRLIHTLENSKLVDPTFDISTNSMDSTGSFGRGLIPLVNPPSIEK